MRIKVIKKDKTQEVDGKREVQRISERNKSYW